MLFFCRALEILSWHFRISDYTRMLVPAFNHNFCSPTITVSQVSLHASAAAQTKRQQSRMGWYARRLWILLRGNSIYREGKLQGSDLASADW
jgi:hypothetical protein